MKEIRDFMRMNRFSKQRVFAMAAVVCLLSYVAADTLRSSPIDKVYSEANAGVQAAKLCEALAGPGSMPIARESFGFDVEGSVEGLDNPLRGSLTRDVMVDPFLCTTSISVRTTSSGSPILKIDLAEVTKGVIIGGGYTSFDGDYRQVDTSDPPSIPLSYGLVCSTDIDNLVGDGSPIKSAIGEVRATVEVTNTDTAGSEGVRFDCGAAG